MLDRKVFDTQIQEMSRAIYAYCLARTSSRHDAQDLAQDILLEIYRCIDSIRDERAFYGFMWAVAGNVYKRWCRKKRQDTQLRERLISIRESRENTNEDDLVVLLRRELALLSKTYREAAVLYYVRNKSCEEIADMLGISVSMVKYLLFKTRQIVKEGMNMERNYGEQSYHPRELELQFWGCNSSHYADACESKIAQNILFACYQDKLTAEQISLEIGVMQPYMEDDLKRLHNYGLLIKEGRKYTANVVVFTETLVREIRSKTKERIESAAGMIAACIEEKNGQRKAGTLGSNCSPEVLSWQITCMLLYQAVVVRILNEHQFSNLSNRTGAKCLIWAVERNETEPGKIGISNGQNSTGDYIQFMDFCIHGEMLHRYCSSVRPAVNLLLDIARGKTQGFSENDWMEVAEMIERGYVISAQERIAVNMPVYTQTRYDQLLRELEEPILSLECEMKAIVLEIEETLKNQIPQHLKRSEQDLAHLRLLEDGISAVVECLLREKVLTPYRKGEMLATTYIVLKEN